MTDTDLTIAAQNLCDKHVVKMVLEGCQVLSTAIRFHIGDLDNEIIPCYSKDNPVEDGIYKTAHLNHGSSVWARENISNFTWLFDHTYAIAVEYQHRYKKIHSSFSVLENILQYIDCIPLGTMTPLYQAVPEEYKQEDVVKAYREYYVGDKSEFAVWNMDPSRQPDWYPDTDLTIASKITYGQISTNSEEILTILKDNDSISKRSLKSIVSYPELLDKTVKLMVLCKKIEKRSRVLYGNLDFK